MGCHCALPSVCLLLSHHYIQLYPLGECLAIQSRALIKIEFEKVFIPGNLSRGHLLLALNSSPIHTGGDGSLQCRERTRPTARMTPFTRDAQRGLCWLWSAIGQTLGSLRGLGGESLGLLPRCMKLDALASPDRIGHVLGEKEKPYETELIQA